MNLDAFKTNLIKMTASGLILYLKQNNLLVGGRVCIACSLMCKEAFYSKVKDKLAWHCGNVYCVK